jgi:hypothetical protein
MTPGHSVRRLAAIAGVAAIIAMGAVTVAQGGSSANAPVNTPTTTTSW